MRRRKWKSQIRIPGWKKISILLLVIVTSFAMLTFIFIEKNLQTPLMNVAKIRLKQIATRAINKAITESMAQAEDVDKLIDWKTDKEGKVAGFMLNYAEHMKITSETVQVAQGILDQLQKIPEHIPLGMALNSAILASFGPDIPVRFVPAGAVKVDLSTRQKDAGINMILVEVYIRIIAEVTIIIPFDTEPEIVETELPISYLLVVGDVPMYYFDNKGKPLGDSAALPPNISLPNFNSAPDQPEDDEEAALE
ncbi:MAG TPA: sporulation protein YunB [Bacilli bacterium]